MNIASSAKLKRNEIFIHNQDRYIKKVKKEVQEMRKPKRNDTRCSLTLFPVLLTMGTVKLKQLKQGE
ncbi:CLUMA_CG019809, isoform A [Clunio marinus]|uniref:CLUMA_CG019809, isoform A n=1 Tax=Clunio marinus TaxID=568069 RepID=A0A1J1J216_9DIPT|nr:CLUMA_CG019809, isoform A [Clunio marinus]